MAVIIAARANILRVKSSGFNLGIRTFCLKASGTGNRHLKKHFPDLFSKCTIAKLLAALKAARKIQDSQIQHSSTYHTSGFTSNVF